MPLFAASTSTLIPPLAWELVVEKLKGVGSRFREHGGAAKINAAGEPLHYRVGMNRAVADLAFRSRSGLKANTMRKLLPLSIAIFVIFSHLNGEPVAINPESVSSVHPTAPGYPVGTMIDLQNGSEIVKEPFAEVVKKLETGAARNDEKIRNHTQ